MINQTNSFLEICNWRLEIILIKLFNSNLYSRTFVYSITFNNTILKINSVKNIFIEINLNKILYHTLRKCEYLWFNIYDI